MALELPNSIFFHVGRTAGHWVRHVVKRMDIPTTEIGEFHDWPSRIAMTQGQERKLRFCFIRHPLEWLRSYWLHQMYFGWSNDDFSENAKSDNFADFLLNSISIFVDGPVSGVYGPFIEQCGFVGRQESIVDDLLRALARAREKCIPQILYETKAINVDIPADLRCYAVASESLLKKVMESERALCQKWGYSSIPLSMVGEPRTLVSFYVPLDRPSAGLPVPEALAEHRFDNAFRVGDLRISGREDNRRTTKLLKDVLESIDFTGKSVVDTACGDGIFALFAEARGAQHVVAVDSVMKAGTVSVLGPALKTKVDFRRGSFYGLDQEIGERFDIVFCFGLLEALRYPFLAFRTLSRLLNDGGVLVLECGYLKALEDKPILLCPFGSQAPVLPENCTYFNRRGLIDGLSAFGFTDVEIRYEFQHALPTGREFDALNTAENEEYNVSESQIGRAALTCRWRSSGYGQQGDPPTTAYLMDYWDSRLPPTDIPMYQPEVGIVNYFREQFSDGLRKIAELEGALSKAAIAVSDRDHDVLLERNELEARSNDLVECTDELVETREVLLERTLRLEASEKTLVERTDELVETREVLLERTLRLEASEKALVERADELVKTREAVAERTELLEQTGKELLERTQELIETREALAARSELLGKSSEELLARTDELVETREALAERSELLAKSGEDLLERTQELVGTRQVLCERTELLERTSKDLLGRTQELVETRQTLSQLTELLAKSGEELVERTQELVETREALAERTELLEKASQDVLERTQDLVATRDALTERTELLAKSGEELVEQTQELVETREALAERTELLEKASQDVLERTQDLVATRQTLSERTELLEHVNADLIEKTSALKNIEAKYEEIQQSPFGYALKMTFQKLFK